MGAVPALLKQLQDAGGGESGDEAAGALWALAPTPEHAGRIIAAGGVPLTVAHLVSGGPQGREAAAALLGAFATAPNGAAALIDAGAAETLTEVLRGPEAAAAAAAAAAVAALAPAGSKAAGALARLSACIVQPPGAPPRRPAALRVARQMCALIEQIVYDTHITRPRHTAPTTGPAAANDTADDNRRDDSDLDDSSLPDDTLAAMEAVEGGSRSRAIAALFLSAAAWQSPMVRQCRRHY